MEKLCSAFDKTVASGRVANPIGRILALTAIALALVVQDSRAGGLAFDASGNLYLSNQDSVLKFAPDGTKSTFVTGLNNASGLAFDHEGNLFVSDIGTQTIYRVAPDGTKSPFATKILSFGLATDPADNLYATQGSSVDKFAPDGTKSTFASKLGSPRDVVTDAAGNVYVLSASDAHGFSLNKFRPDGKVLGFSIYTPAGKPGGVAIDAAGNIYLTKVVEGKGNQAILKFGQDGAKSTFAAAEDAITLGGIAADAKGNVFVFNGAAMDNDAIRKYDDTGARTVSASPDKQWEYRLVNETYPEITKAGERKVAVDFANMNGKLPDDDNAIVWAPDSKSFSVTYSPPHPSHTSYDTLVIYQLRNDKWVETTPLVDLQSDLSQLAQLGKGRLPKKLSREHAGERDVLQFRKWADANTAIVHVYSEHAEGKASSYDFTLKFDTQGKWKIVEMRPSTAKK